MSQIQQTQIHECPICMEEVTLTNCCTTECGHRFHSSCLFKNFSNTFACPMCRKELVETNEEDEEDDDGYIWTDDDGEDDDSNNDDDSDEDDDDDAEDDTQEPNRIKKKLSIDQVHEVLKKKGFNEKEFISVIIDNFGFDGKVKIQKETIKRFESFFHIIEDICDGDIEVDHRDSRTYASVLLGAPRTEEPGRGPQIVG